MPGNPWGWRPPLHCTPAHTAAAPWTAPPGRPPQCHAPCAAWQRQQVTAAAEGLRLRVEGLCSTGIPTSKCSLRQGQRRQGQRQRLSPHMATHPPPWVLPQDRTCAPLHTPRCTPVPHRPGQGVPTDDSALPHAQHPPPWVHPPRVPLMHPWVHTCAPLHTPGCTPVRCVPVPCSTPQLATHPCRTARAKGSPDDSPPPLSSQHTPPLPTNHTGPH